MAPSKLRSTITAVTLVVLGQIIVVPAASRPSPTCYFPDDYREFTNLFDLMEQADYAGLYEVHVAKPYDDFYFSGSTGFYILVSEEA